MINLTRCKCVLSDCAYYHRPAPISGECDCSHPEKNFYMVNPCPLYRKNWQASIDSEKSADIRARFIKRRI